MPQTKFEYVRDAIRTYNKDFVKHLYQEFLFRYVTLCLKKYLTQSEEMVFIWRVWEHKLITSTLQLGKLIYHKPNSYDSVLRQWNLSVSQSMKRWVNYQPVFQSVIYLPNNTKCFFNIKDKQLHTAFPTNSGH